MLSLLDDLFEEMHGHLYLYLGIHPNLVRLPSFQGLLNVTHTLLYLFMVTECRHLSHFVGITELSKIISPYHQL